MSESSPQHEAIDIASSSQNSLNKPNPQAPKLSINSLMETDTSSEQLKQQQQPQQQQQQAGNIVSVDKKSSNIGGITNLFKCIVGSGILALPYTFNQAGYVYGICFLVVLGLVVYYTNVLLIKVGDRILSPGQTYIDVCDKVLHQYAALAMRVFFIFGACAGCISYVIFFVTFFEHVLEDQFPTTVYLLFALLIIFPMSLINDLRGMVKFMFLANSMLALTIISILIYNLNDLFDPLNSAFDKNKDNTFNLDQASLMIGVGLYAFDGINVIMGVRDSLKKPEDFVSRVLNVTNMLVAVLYVVFSVIGALAKGGDGMEEIILFDMPDSWYMRTLQILYAIVLAFSYPLLNLAALQIMEQKDTFIGKFISKANGDKTQTIIRRTAFRTLVTLIIILFAFLIPRFAIAINLFGSISGAALQFFLPLYSFYTVFKNEISTFQKIFNFIILGVGLFGCLLGIYGSISELL